MRATTTPQRARSFSPARAQPPPRRSSSLPVGCQVHTRSRWKRSSGRPSRPAARTSSGTSFSSLGPSTASGACQRRGSPRVTLSTTSKVLGSPAQQRTPTSSRRASGLRPRPLAQRARRSPGTPLPPRAVKRPGLAEVALPLAGRPRPHAAVEIVDAERALAGGVEAVGDERARHAGAAGAGLVGVAVLVGGVARALAGALQLELGAEALALGLAEGGRLGSA